MELHAGLEILVHAHRSIELMLFPHSAVERKGDILVDVCTLVEDTQQNLNPISTQAVIKAAHLLVDKLISSKSECHSRIPPVSRM